MRRKISAHVDGGMSGGSSVRRPGSEDPHWREWNSKITLFILTVAQLIIYSTVQCCTLIIEPPDIKYSGDV